MRQKSIKPMETKQPSFTILMFPWLAHGHIYPYLELAKNLSTKNFKIFFLSTPNNLTSIRDALESTPSNGVSIHLLELHLPSLPELPLEYQSTKNVPPNLKDKLIEALNMSKSSFSTVITSLKPDILIYDWCPVWAPAIASSLSIPAVHFATCGAASHSLFYHLVRHNHSPFPYSSTLHFRDYELEDFESTIHTPDGFKHFDQSSNIILMRTCMGIEDKYADYLSTICHKKIVPVGPLIAPPTTNHSHTKMMEWLSTKKQFSTVFISFGSENYLSNDQIFEMAKGLELASSVNFVWVLRFPPNVQTNITEALPEGFLERVKDRGMIVIQGWVPQTTILGHPSIGAFVSHCGMSSIIESTYLGVPVIGIPIRIDQPLNAKLLVEAGVGIEVERVANGHFTGEEVADVLNKVIVMKIGEGMRLKAAELSKRMKSEEEHVMSGVVEQLRQMCVEHKAKREAESI